MSWGVSKIGRVSQVIDSEENMLYSEFDTQIFSLTVVFPRVALGGSRRRRGGELGSSVRRSGRPQRERIAATLR